MDIFDIESEEVHTPQDYIVHLISRFWDDLVGSCNRTYREHIPLSYAGQDADRARALLGGNSLPKDVLAFIDGYPTFKSQYIYRAATIRNYTDLDKYMRGIRRERNEIKKVLFKEFESGPLASIFVLAINIRLATDVEDSGLSSYIEYLNQRCEILENGNSGGRLLTPEEREKLSEEKKKKEKLYRQIRYFVRDGNKKYPLDQIDERLNKVHGEEREVEHDSDYSGLEYCREGFKRRLEELEK